MTARNAPIHVIRTSRDVIAALPAWPVGQQARQFGVSDEALAEFYLPHVAVAHALHAALGATLDETFELLLYGDADRAQNMPLFAAPGCTAHVLRHLLAAPHLARVRLVAPAPSIVPELDPTVRRLFPSLTADGVEVRGLHLAGRADPPDAFVLLPCTDPLDFELERRDHVLWRHMAEHVAIVGVSATRAEAMLLASYFALFGVTVTEAVPVPICSDGSEDPVPALACTWQVVARQSNVEPTHQRLERFGRLLDLLREGDSFPDELFGACTRDPSGPYVQLVHGHWLSIERGTIHYVAGVDELLDAHEPPQAQGIDASVPDEILQRRPASTAPILDRWFWVLDVFEQARTNTIPQFAPTTHFLGA